MLNDDTIETEEHLWKCARCGRVADFGAHHTSWLQWCLRNFDYPWCHRNGCLGYMKPEGLEPPPGAILPIGDGATLREPITETGK